MTKNNELFTTLPVGRAVAKLAIPTVVSQIIVILYSLADTFSLARSVIPTRSPLCPSRFPSTPF